jgi:23S rRNA pseudouridine2605 synthase
VAVERLNKVLAHAGVSSRRQADELIKSGRVMVNDAVTREPGTQVDPAHDVVRLDGQVVPPAERHVYLALNKPRYVVSTASDPLGRATVTALVGGDARLYPAGRLDFDSEGLLILTNDGDLANHLTHPRYGHEKEYRVKISGTPTESTMTTWREGMYLEDGRTAPARVRIESTTGAGTWVRIVLREGRNRQVRRMIEGMHHTVHRLIRLRIGPVALGDLKPGAHRQLTPDELAVLRGDLPADAVAPTEPPGAAKPAEPPAAAKPRRKVYKAGWARPKPRPRHRPSAGSASRRR